MVSEEFLALRDQLKGAPLPADLDMLRQAYNSMGEQFALAEGVRTRLATLGGRPCEWFEPKMSGASQKVVLYFHGGGYCLGSLTSHRHIGAELCSCMGVATVVLDYRLAPENPFPGAVDDGIAAYEELLAACPPSRIALAGDSSGAGLLVAILAAIIQRNLPQPASSYCMSPWVDLECASESIDSKAVEDPWVTKSLLKSNAARYLRKGDDARHPLASPLYADLRGAAPLLIQVGTAEILFDDSIRLAQVLGKANCGVRLDIWPQMLHGWQHFFPAIPEGRAALAGGCEFLQTHFNLAEYA